MAHALALNGPFNMQFLVKEGNVFVIECNVRASRSFPFISKVLGENLIHLATQAMTSQSELPESDLSETNRVIGVKSAMFSFQRLAGADPILGVEMTSTGEVACLGTSLDEALLLSFQASGIKPPKKGVLISAGRATEKQKLIQTVKILKSFDIPIFATPGTAQFFSKQGISLEEVSWEKITETMLDQLQKNQLDFVINIPKDFSTQELSADYQIRTTAIRQGCTLMTNVEKIDRYFSAINSKIEGKIKNQVFALNSTPIS
jgi:carbamoyl-phosphate synthase large subunit